MPSALLRFLPAIAVAAVHGAPRCDGDGDTTAQLQLKERSRSDRVLQSKLQSRLTAFDNSLYWQGYGSESLASYFIGFLGHDTVQVGGLNITAKVGLNLMGNALSGNFYQSVEADAAVLGLLPGCFTGGCNPAYYDDLLSTMAREGKIRRAFSLCFDDSPRGGGKLFLGRPEIPTDAVKIPLHPLTDGLRPYSPLSTFGPSGAGVEFFFGSKRVASRSSEEWNRLIRSGAGYSDTGTPGLVLPSSVLDEVLTELRRKLLADEMCASMWGPYLPKLTAQHLDSLTVSSTAASCALRHVVWDILAQAAGSGLHRRVLLGLRHIHARGIVHRDIKSMNLFLTDEGVIKLGDFGVSRQMSEKTMCLHSFYGTPLYFSPEIIEGRPYSHSTDLWSLGVVLYELLSLELPFKGPSLQDVIAAVLRGQYAPLSRPAEFNQVVSMLLTRDAEKRPNADELLRRLGRMGRLRRAEHWSPAGKPIEPEKTPEGDVLVRVRRASRESSGEAKSDPKGVASLAKVPARHERHELFAALPGPAPNGSNGNAREERYERRRQAHFQSTPTEASKSSNDSEETAPNVLLAPPGLTRAVPKRLAS